MLLLVASVPVLRVVCAGITPATWISPYLIVVVPAWKVEVVMSRIQRSAGVLSMGDQVNGCSSDSSVVVMVTMPHAGIVGGLGRPGW